MLSKSAKYGIRAVLYVAWYSKKEKRVSVQEIAESVNAPHHFTGKILQTLAKHNIISSIKGPNGGFEMSEKQRTKFNIRSIVEILDGNGLYTECAIGLEKCNDAQPCPVHHIYVSIRKALLDMHTKKSIDELSDQLDSLSVLVSE